MTQWNVTPQESGSKLINFLSAKLGSQHSARSLKRSLEANSCTINGRIERFGSAVIGRGDVVDFQLGDLRETHQTSRFTAPKILYRDCDLVIIDKPAGIASDNAALVDALGASDSKLLLVHRLDRETSGILIFACRPEVAKAMVELFRERKVKKKYLAIVDGVPKAGAGAVRNHLAKLHAYQGQSLWGKVEEGKGLWAETEWSVISKTSKSSLIACVPLTGRTHQIRVHLSGIGHPILGDKQYGKLFVCAYRPKRCLLHASEIAFPHPMGLKPISVVADLPADFKTAMKELGHMK